MRASQIDKRSSLNTIYRLIWSDLDQTWVAVAETARGRGKRSGGRPGRSGISGAIHGIAALAGALVLSMASSMTAYAADPASNALPQGAQYDASQVSISTNGNNMLIEQNNQRTIINWDSYNIGSAAWVHYQQPSSSAIALNRVLGGEVSQIFGTLTSTGQIWLINPAGVLFGQGSRVDVGGLVAGTLDISDNDFNTGRNIFNRNGATGSIINQGSLKAADGSIIALLAPEVINEGIISARLGNVALAAGERVTLEAGAEGHLQLAVDPATIDTLIDNRHLIMADGGQVIMSASAASEIASAVVNNSGSVQARSLSHHAGSIRLESSGGHGSIANTGTLDVSGRYGADGGNIAIDGDFVALGGQIKADGINGGSIDVHANGTLSLADRVSATGNGGQGGTIRYTAGGQIIENSGSLSDVSGKSGGSIRLQAGNGLLSSGTYLARGNKGKGGSIDLSGYSVRLLSATLDASGTAQGGLIRIGGAYQGGKAGSETDPNYVTRFGDLADISNSQRTFINDSTHIDVSSSKGQGGTAIIWSDIETTMTGSIKASGATQGGYVEISSADTLRRTELTRITGAQQLLLDPKNIVIADLPTTYSWAYEAIMGKGYTGGKNVDVGSLETVDAYGFSVALNAAGDRLAVGAAYDGGFANNTSYSGAVYLYSFADGDFSGAALQGMVGKGYVGGNNVNVSSLDSFDMFGFSVSLNAAGDRLAVGAYGDSGSGNTTSGAGAVYLFGFNDGDFGGGSLNAVIGKGYAGAGNLDLAMLENGDGFGSAVALNAAGDRLLVGAIGDDGADNGTSSAGALYMFSSADNNFSGPALEGIAGKGYSGGKNVDLAGLEANDYFGRAVAVNAAGNRVAASAYGDDGLANATTNAGAVYLFSFVDGDFGGGFLEGVIGKGYTGGKNVDMAALDDFDHFGSGLGLSAAGDRLAVGAYRDGGFGNSNGNAGAVYLLSFADGDFNGASQDATLGKGYAGANETNMTALDSGDYFGASVAMNAAGDRLAVGAYGDSGNGNSTSIAGAVYLFKGAPAYLYSEQPGQNVNISASDLAALLSAGTDVTLQASNDLTLDALLSVNNGSGDGGTLTLQAGRSLLLNNSIVTDNGDLTLIANDTLANGVVDAYRDNGPADITMANGTSIDAGTGNVSILLDNGAGKTNSAAGAMTLTDINAGSITAVTTSATSDIILNGTLTASAGGDSIILASAGNFTNNSGANALDPGAGRFLVYSQNPLLDNRGGLGYDFKQYNATNGITPVAGTGDGFLYTIAPVITPGLTGLVSKVYDGNTDATLAPANYTVAGVIDGDTVTLNDPVSGSYDTKDVGTGKTVTVNGIAIDSTTNGSANVYGYQLAGSSASGPIGEITADPDPQALKQPGVVGAITNIGPPQFPGTEQAGTGGSLLVPSDAVATEAGGRRKLAVKSMMCGSSGVSYESSFDLGFQKNCLETKKRE